MQSSKHLKTLIFELMKINNQQANENFRISRIIQRKYQKKTNLR